MRLLLVVLSMVCVFGCSSTTVGPSTPWGTLGDISFAPADAFLLATTAANGDYNFVVIAVDHLGYCNVLQQNVNGYLANMNYATFTINNAVGAGQVDPPPGVYPIAALSPNGPSAQAAFGSISACTVSSFSPTGTSGSVTEQEVAVDDSQMVGSVNVVFGASGTLAGSFNVPLCDLSNSVQGPSACFQ